MLHVWNRNDMNTCGAMPMNCPLRDGTSPDARIRQCAHEPLRTEILAKGPSSKSRDLRVCVSTTTDPGGCTVHVVTAKHLVNTDPAEAADYNATIMSLGAGPDGGLAGPERRKAALGAQDMPPAPARPPVPVCGRLSLSGPPCDSGLGDGAHVDGLGALVAGLGVVLDASALRQGLEAVA